MVEPTGKTLPEFKVSRACEDSGVDSSVQELLSFLQGIVSESAEGELKVKLRTVLPSADGNSEGKLTSPRTDFPDCRIRV